MTGFLVDVKTGSRIVHAAGDSNSDTITNNRI